MRGKAYSPGWWSQAGLASWACDQCSDVRCHIQKVPLLGLKPSCPYLEIMNIFGQVVLHFHFTLGPELYVACPDYTDKHCCWNGFLEYVYIIRLCSIMVASSFQKPNQFRLLMIHLSKEYYTYMYLCALSYSSIAITLFMVLCSSHHTLVEKRGAICKTRQAQERSAWWDLQTQRPKVTA